MPKALEFVRPIRLEVEYTSIGDVLQNAVTLAERKGASGRHPRPGPGSTAACRRSRATIINSASCSPTCSSTRSRRSRARGAVEVSAREGLLEEDFHPSGWGGTASGHADGDRGGVRQRPRVPRDLRDRIFNAFFTTKPQGSGLGLAIVRKIVDAHDGRIDIQTGGLGTCSG